MGFSKSPNSSRPIIVGNSGVKTYVIGDAIAASGEPIKNPKAL